MQTRPIPEYGTRMQPSLPDLMTAVRPLKITSIYPLCQYKEKHRKVLNGVTSITHARSPRNWKPNMTPASLKHVLIVGRGAHQSVAAAAEALQSHAAIEKVSAIVHVPLTRSTVPASQQHYAAWKSIRSNAASHQPTYSCLS